MRRYHASLVRLARASVASHAVAEEVAQDTWLAVIKGIRGFEGRSSLKTWLFQILVNQARKRGRGSTGSSRCRRWVPTAAMAMLRPWTRTVSCPIGQRWAGYWCAPPVSWTDLPAERVISKETVALVASVVNELPDRQREVVTLRDVEGWTAAEVCGSARTVYQCRDNGHNWIEREELDAYLVSQVFLELSGPDAYPHLPDGSEETAVVALRAEEAALRAELDGYADDAAEGKIDRSFAAKVVAKLQTRITDAQRRIEAAITPPALAGLLAGDPGEDVATRWDRAPTSGKREVLRLLFAEIVIRKGPGDVDERVVIRSRRQA